MTVWSYLQFKSPGKERLTSLSLLLQKLHSPFISPFQINNIKMNNSYASPSSSPPTPPSPLPISVGPGCQKYYFSSSPSPTPPFSPPSSRHTSAESLPLLNRKLSNIPPPPRAPSAFSLDLQLQDPSRPHNNTSTSSSCLKDLLEWLVLRCCRHCSLPI